MKSYNQNQVLYTFLVTLYMTGPDNKLIPVLLNCEMLASFLYTVAVKIIQLPLGKVLFARYFEQIRT
jgi:hypothetical protein